MKLPLTPIRCLYRGVDLYGHKVEWCPAPTAIPMPSSASAASASLPVSRRKAYSAAIVSRSSASTITSSSKATTVRR